MHAVLPLLAAAFLLLASLPARALVPFSGATRLASGATHACVVTTAGGVKCWGLNNSGELGEGTTGARFTPVDVTGLTSGVASVAVGLDHTCALTTGGGVKCWGRNVEGELGDGTTTNRSTPVDVSGLTSGVAAIAAGGFHSCAIMSGTGALKCWGHNFNGQVGDGTTTTPRLTPTDVSGLASGVTSISAGDYFTCAVVSGGAKCWGYNLDGEIGDNTTLSKSIPTDVSGLTSGVAAIVTGRYHTCAVTTVGGAKCWGFNTFGSLGDGTLTQRPTPVDVSGLASGVAALSANHYHTCALTTGGGVKCWGYNPFGELGDNTTNQSSSPVDVAALTTGVTAIATGEYHSCALVSGGGVKCWGGIGIGYLGGGADTREAMPVDVVGLTSGVASIVGGNDHACVVTTGGGAKCWGRNDRGWLGDNTNLHRNAPVDVTGLTSGVAAIAPGTQHTCALDTGGAVQCWGRNNLGQLGNGSSAGGPGVWTPGSVSGLTSGIVAVVSGADHSCALTTGGGVKCWGINANGQLGDGTTTQRNAPVDVTGLTSGVAAIAAGTLFTCAVTTGGGAKCWGSNANGQLGDGTQTQRLTPVDVTGLTSGIAKIATGENHTCALTTGGGVKCWGLNSDTQLGDNSTVTRRLTPVNVVGLSSGVTAITVGDQQSCALTTGGGMKCWGYNGSNRLGDGSVTARKTPVDVVALTSGVTAIASGGSHLCALTTGGGVKCWGNNANGQVGNGATISRPVSDVLALDATVFKEISTSTSHSLALDATGKVYAWGSDSYGQLGQGRAINRLSPAQVTGLPSIIYISLSGHALAVDAFNQVWSWGENGCGQLGPREATLVTLPSRVVGLANVTKVAAGECFSLALKADGTVWGWGHVPGYGDPADTGIRQITGLSGIVDIDVGSSHALARDGSGNVFAFGDNADGQLGLGGAGAIQAAAQVTALTGVTAIAAGGESSMAITSGGIYFWGMRQNQPSVATPTPLPAPPGTAVAISLEGIQPFAALADGSVYNFDSTIPAWQLLPGFAGIAKLSGSGASAYGIDGTGQLFAWGINTAGQLGQGDTTARVSAIAVPGQTPISMVAATNVSGSVLALKNDGSVWFWGADTAGQGGVGAQVSSSVPLLVSIPAIIRQVATGDRYSIALDTNGNAWTWGDNSGAVLNNTLVNRSTSATTAVRNVVSVAAGGPGLLLFLLSDGTVRKAGALAYVGASVDPIIIPGLSNIVALAAGDNTGYALRGDGVVFAFGGSANGELGNGTTTFSAAAVQVQGITGSVTKISAAPGRAGAVTSDGKVWTWGAAPLGNGSSGGSLTAVQVPGITDAADISVGTTTTLVRRTNGSMLAWGATGLDDSTSQNVLLPYSIAFHEPVKSVTAGRGSALGFIVGNTGLAWGFGSYGAISTGNASIGDGSFVRRTRPVVLLAASGGGNIDTNDWYLDLEPATAETIPVATTPTMLGVSQLYGSDAGLAFDATVKYKSADFGKSVNNYVFGLVPAAFFSEVKSALGPTGHAKIAAAAKAGTYVLAQLTPAGWTDVNGQLLAYSTGTANAAGGATNILNGIPAAKIPGARFCIGYGENSNSMLTFQALREVLLIEGASANTSGVPCVLTGVYVDGPPGSRINTLVTFKASVVGLSPTGTVQFRDGAGLLQSPVTVSMANQAVASASITTSSLALGSHAIGATYGGDTQNAAVATEIPLRHEVVTAATQVDLAGPATSNINSPVVFTATVIGTNPSGTVQFMDGASSLGAAVALVGGQAVLRISNLAAGSHSLTAAYSGDGGNAASSSATLTHVVNAAIATTVALSSSAPSVPAGTVVTITATVNGASPTGTVTFRDGAVPQITVPLVNGSAAFTGLFTAGLHVITAVYSGDNTNAASTSSSFFQEVTQVPVTVGLTVSRSGAGAGTVTSSALLGINCGSTCSANLLSGTTVALSATPTAGSAFVGWSGACSGTGTCSFALNAAQGVSARFELLGTDVAVAAPTLAFGGQSLNTTAPTQTFTLTNNSGAPITFMSMVASSVFGTGSGCAVVNPGASCPLYVNFTPVAEGDVAATVVVLYDQGGQTRASVVGVTGTGEKSLVTHYYRSILRRAPDAPGKAFWESEAVRLKSIGANVNETWFAMASFFYFSAEYASFNRDDAGFVTDLYTTFFNRPPDGPGLGFWTGQIASGMPREVVLAAFEFSTEFVTFTQAIFGNTAARAEVDAVVDFYRGLLARLPDGGGFAFWVAQFRTAQCTGAGAVYTQVESISSQFATGGEYTSKGRTNAQYVGDLYNAFLRRGGDLGGVQFWINQLNTSAMTREFVRQQFIASAEFQGRVTNIVNQGCSP